MKTSPSLAAAERAIKAQAKAVRKLDDHPLAFSHCLARAAEALEPVIDEYRSIIYTAPSLCENAVAGNRHLWVFRGLALKNEMPLERILQQDESVSGDWGRTPLPHSLNLAAAIHFTGLTVKTYPSGRPPPPHGVLIARRVATSRLELGEDSESGDFHECEVRFKPTRKDRGATYVWSSYGPGGKGWPGVVLSPIRYLLNAGHVGFELSFHEGAQRWIYGIPLPSQCAKRGVPAECRKELRRLT